MNSSNISILGEQIVQYTESGFQIHIDDVFCACLRLWQTNILHQFERKYNVMYHLLRWLGLQMKIIQWHEESTEQSHQQAQEDTVFEISTQTVHFEVQFVQVFVDKSYQRFLNHGQFVGGTIKQRIECISFATHTDIIVLRSDLLLKFSVRYNGRALITCSMVISFLFNSLRA